MWRHPASPQLTPHTALTTLPAIAMAETKTTLAADPVRQFSVFAENRVGRLYDLTALFKTNNVHIMAITVLDTTDSAVIRLIVDDREKARELMVNNDFPYTECDVLAVEIDDERCLRDVLSALLEAEINVHYVYSFIKRPDGKAALALNIEDADVAAQALNTRGFKVLTQRDISR
ncbi:MAG: acetolactate synthase [Verrucomicrobia bacterium]|nr:acetolactate synthase [Verrucomicrobiota bacterium]